MRQEDREKDKERFIFLMREGSYVTNHCSRVSEAPLVTTSRRRRRGQCNPSRVGCQQ